MVETTHNNTKRRLSRHTTFSLIYIVNRLNRGTDPKRLWISLSRILKNRI